MAFSSGAAASRYLYDWQGLRRAKMGASGVGYLWGDGEMVEEQPAGGGGKIAYARGVDGTVVGLGGERALHDGLGGVSGRAGASATLYRIDAWGHLQADPADGNRWAVPPSGGPSLGFGATHWDTDAGLYYAQQRWYDPRTGRWLSEDPVFGDLSVPMSLNPFGYGNSNPLRWADPTGERAKTAAEEQYVATIRRLIEVERQRPGFLKLGSRFAVWQAENYLERLEKAIAGALEGEPVVAVPREGQDDRIHLGVGMVGPFDWDERNRVEIREPDPVGETALSVAGAPRSEFTAVEINYSVEFEPALTYAYMEGIDLSTAEPDALPATAGPKQTQQARPRQRSSRNVVYRQLSAADREALEAGRDLTPRGVGGSIAGHVAGEETEHISAALSAEAAERFNSGNGLVEIDVARARALGATFIDHRNVVSAVRSQGSLSDVRNAVRAQEVLFRGSVPRQAIRIVRGK